MTTLPQDWLVLSVFSLFGLIIGSFLNVVIYRLPIMMERQWSNDADESANDTGSYQRFNLVVPRSGCPTCGVVLKWHQNIPILSYLVQKGRCAHCAQPISPKYPLVELFCAGLFLGCAWTYPWPLHALIWSGFCAVLLTAAVIDWETTYLPDVLTLPLMWAGLLFALVGWVPLALNQAVWGAIVGYLFLWTIYWAFKLITGKEGMGHGDFKLLAALGAWLGPVAIIPVLLISCILGTLYAVILRVSGRLAAGQAFAFGPFLALSGFVLCFWKPLVLHLLGLPA